MASITKANKAASEHVRRRTTVRSDVFARLQPQIRQRAFTVSGIEDLRTLAKIRDLIAELPEGADWNTQKRQIADELQTHWGPKAGAAANRRAELLLRVNGGQAYAAARYAEQQEFKEDYPYLIYITMGDGSVRDEHAALDGVILPVDDPFWRSHYPPWDFNCRCLVESISAEEAREQGIWSDKDKERFERNELGRDPMGYSFDPATLYVPVDEVLADFEKEDADSVKDALGKVEVVTAEGEVVTALDKPDVEAPAFAPAKTIPEALRWTKKHVAEKVSTSKKYELEVLNKVNELLADRLKKWGLKKFPEFRETRSRKLGVIAAISRTLSGKTVAFEMKTENLSDSKKLYKENVTDMVDRKRTRYLAFGDEESVMAHVIDHEIAHVLFGRSKLEGKYGKIKAAYDKAKKTGDINKISQYAAKYPDGEEMFAEAFAMHSRGDELPDYIKTMVEEIIK
jgi:SPP1 gp7 family putative phage head morphogenesis protein